jgi:acyl-CoA reductase-like NAD-dependent aldehyde dehydrogenase
MATHVLQRTISPVDGSVYAEFEAASDQQIETALENARRAQREWKLVSLEERITVCLRMVDWMVARAEDIGVELTWQMGRPIAHSPFEIRRGFQERVRHMADIAADALADIEVGRKPDLRRFIATSRSASCW